LATQPNQPPSFDLAALADKIWELFVNRLDTYALQKTDGTYRRIEEAVTKELIQQHLSGTVTIGVYQVDPTDDIVKWICLDVDPTKVPNPTEVVKSLYGWAVKTWPRESVLVEASRYPDESYHIWVFFAEPIPADVARWLGKLWNERAGQPNVEVFPKQESVEGRFGNLVKLPLGLHREAKKWSRLLNPETFQPLANGALLKVAPAILTEQQIAEIKSRIAAAKKGEPPPTNTADLQAVDLKSIPCVKAFHDTPIPPSYRHMAPAKNIAILYWQIKGSWQGFEEWAE